MRLLRSLSLGALALSLASCGGGGDTSTSNTTQVLTSVVISSSGASVAVGQAMQFTASPRDQNGTAMAATVTWSSSSTSIATVTSNGLVNGVGSGVATITAVATAGGTSVSSSRQITVTGSAVVPVLTSITIITPSTTIGAGASMQLSATPRDQNGVGITAVVTWSTSDATKATVSNTGLVTAGAQGTVTITASASAGGATVSNSVLLTISPPGSSVLTTLVVSPTSATLAGGETVQLSATPLDQNGAAMNATVTWTSSDGGKASVSSTGLVTAHSDGTATITASATAGGVTLTHTIGITVSSFGFNADITATVFNTFSPTSVDIAVGGTVTWTFATLHNVTFTTGGSPQDIPNTPSGSVTRSFPTAGTFSFVCTLHGGMSGSVIVH